MYLLIQKKKCIYLFCLVFFFFWINMGFFFKEKNSNNVGCLTYFFIFLIKKAYFSIFLKKQ